MADGRVHARLLAGLGVAVSVGLGVPGAVLAAPPEAPNLHSWPTTTMPPPLRPAAAETAADDSLVAPIRTTDPDGPLPSAEPEAAPAASVDDDGDAAVPLRGSVTATSATGDDGWQVDGVPEAPEPRAPIDGGNPQVDTRAEADYRAFNPSEPPAGHDARAFSIEPEPLADRAPRRFARLDPYVPAGIRVGSFTLYPEAEIAGVATSNLFRSHANQRSDLALETRSSLRLISNWNVHAMELAAYGLTSFHNDYASENDRNWGVEARGQLDVTRRANLQAFATHDVAQETRGSINFGTPSSSRADVTTDRAGIAFNQRFNRLTIQLRGALTERDYAAKIDETTGFAVSSLDRDLSQREAAVRATWMFKPELGVFGEAAFDDRSFAAANPVDHMSRNSSGERYRAGVSLGSSSQVLRGEAAVGLLRQGFDDARLPEVTGVVVDANVAWRMTGLTSLLITMRTDVGESTVAGSGGSLLRQTGLELKHAFTRNLVGTAGIKVSRADYQGTGISERDLTAEARLDYYVSRQVTLFGRYAHVDYASSTAGSAYGADEVRLGVRVQP